MAQEEYAQGVKMKASEFGDDGCELIRSKNSELSVVKLDLSTYCEKFKWYLVVARESYPSTRVDAFTDQYTVVERPIESLTPNGVLLLIASDVSFPNCPDQKFFDRTLRKEINVRDVIRVLEPVAMRLADLSNKLLAISRVVEICLKPIIHWKKCSPGNFAAIQIIGV